MMSKTKKQDEDGRFCFKRKEKVRPFHPSKSICKMAPLKGASIFRKARQTMKTLHVTKMTTVITTLLMGLSLCLPVASLAAEKSVIVGFHQKPGPSEKALIHEARGIIKQSYRLIPAMAVSLPEEEIGKIKKNHKVAYVEEDIVYKAVEPMSGDEYANSWGVQHIGADIAHGSGNGGTGVSVAVIDTGIDFTHSDLVDNFVDGINFVRKIDGTVDPLDFFDYSSNSHGTHVAGVIAAGSNGFGVIGVAPQAGLYAVRVLDGAGIGDLSWIIAGIQWSVENGVDIANVSLEGPHAQSLQDACDAAYSAGVLLVAATGNLGLTVRFPAAYESVIAVTATDASDMKVFLPSGPEVELSAPGVDILSTVAGGVYDVLSGTSQAAPHVAGTAALFLASDLQDINGDGVINNEDIRQKLQMTATDLGEAGRDTIFGFGLVNAAEAALPVDWPLEFTLMRTSGSAADDAKAVLLTDALFKIKIKNDDLKKVMVDVFENGIIQKKLSSSYNLDENEEVIFNLDAAGTSYEVAFTPKGKTGTSAEIEIDIR
jgi:subtilisin